MSRFLEPIRSLSNPRVRDWVRLRNGRRRREAGRFLIDGSYETTMAVEAGLILEEILLSEELDEKIVENWSLLAEMRDTPIRLISDSAMTKVSVRENPDGVIGVGVTPDRSLSLPDSCDGPILVMNRLEKPGNLGALIRSAYAAGAVGIVLCDPAVDFENPQVIRASRGLVFHLPGWVATPTEAKKLFQERSLPLFAADKLGEQDYWETQLPSTPVIILGEEHAGLPEDWNLPEVQRLRIPMQEGIDSLNVSVSGALLLYEWKRQRVARSEIIRK